MRSLSALLFLFFWAGTVSANEPLADRIGEIFKEPCLREAQACMMVKSLGTGEVNYSMNPNRLMTPASNNKIVTSLAALDILKPTFKFDTFFSYSGTRSNGVIEGDLVVTGRGDPHIVSEDLWVMADELRKRGIRRITGNLVLDDSYFDSERFPPSWKPSKMRRAFEAPTGALSLNFNSLTISIYPSDTVNEKPVAALSPQTPYLKLVNNIRTTNKGRNFVTIEIQRREGGGETVILGGRVRAGSKEKTYYRYIEDPILYFGMTFLSFLAKAGIEVEKGIVHSTPSDPLHEVYVHSSRPLLNQLMDMNKFSNNFMAEQILKTIGAETASPPGSFENGLVAMREFLSSIGVTSKRYSVIDGSGLGRGNRLSCSVIVDLLESSYSKWGVAPEFLVSLSLVGRDGSMKERLVSTSKVVRVKTGTLNSISALSGYYQRDSGDIFVFSVVLNDLACSYQEAMDLQDQILLELLETDDGKN